MKKFSLNKVEAASKEAQEEFWQALRYFYRTGEKPSDDQIDKLSSPFEHLIPHQDHFPFQIGTTDIEYTDGWVHRLLNVHVDHFQVQIRNQFQQELNGLINGLGRLLGEKEQHNDDEVYDFAADIITFDKLKAIIPSQNKNSLSDARKQRLHQVLNHLKEGLGDYNGKQTNILFHQLNFQKELYEKARISQIQQKPIFDEAKALLKHHMDAFTRLIRAFRMAKLEVDDAYDPAIHDLYFDHFTWYRLFEKEKQLFHPFVMLIDAQELDGNLDALTQLLRTNWPIRLMVINQQMISDPKQEVSWDDASHAYRQELLTTLVAQRNVYYHQSTADDPKGLSAAIKLGLAQNLPVVWQVLSDPEEESKGLQKAIAAQWGKHFPHVKYDPKAKKGQSRLQLLSTADKSPWEDTKLVLVDGEKETELNYAFTYADYKALFEVKRKELMLVPEAYANDQFIPLATYLALSETELYGKIPFIWLVDEAGELKRAAVHNHWVVSCQERAEFWSFLTDWAVNPVEEGKEEVPVKTAELQVDYEKLKEEATTEAVTKLLEALLKE